MQETKFRIKQSEGEELNSPLIEVPPEKRTRSALKAGIFAIVAIIILSFFKIVDFSKFTQTWQWFGLLLGILVFAFVGFMSGFPSSWKYN